MLIFREVIALIVNLDILETTLKQVILAEMAEHVLILLEVTAVIANQDILESAVKQEIIKVNILRK